MCITVIVSEWYSKYITHCGNLQMMNKFKRFSFLLLLPLLISAMVHKFYVSVTHMEYSEENSAIQITTRIFIDDLEEVLNARYDINAALATEEEVSGADTFIKRYLDSKMRVNINGEQMSYDYVGKEYKDDLVICYLEIDQIQLSEVLSVEVTNDLLTEFFDEQQNVVHLKFGSVKKSFILVRENNKGMLNL